MLMKAPDRQGDEQPAGRARDVAHRFRGRAIGRAGGRRSGVGDGAAASRRRRHGG